MTTSEQARTVAAVFDRAADTYDAVGVPWFTPIAARLVAELAPRPGERALDIGCGRGAALWPLADGVGSGGRVVGIDLAERMVASTRAEAASRGMHHVDLAVMDAAEPELPAASFDVVAASLVLFLLPDPVAALRSWLDLLVPGGRFGISSFGKRAPAWVNLDAVFTPYLPQQMLDARTSGARDPFATDGGVEGLVSDAGFTGVRTVGFDLSATFDDIDHWYRWSWSHGQRAIWEMVPEAERPDVRSAASAVLETIRGADGRLHLTQRIRLTLASRPGGPAASS